MKTGETVTDLGLYITDCCGMELVFDTGDSFMKCPSCNHLCEWELEEEIVPSDDLERVSGMAA
jgi:hypothetical protein